MNDMKLTDQQWAGVKRIVHWFKHETHQKQIARIFGYAGCGKSTMLKFVLDELGLEPHKGDREGDSCVPGVVTATFTGRPL
jgi:exodeoxyribonuclease V